MRFPKKRTLIEIICTLLGVAFLFGAWALASGILEGQGNHLLPGPDKTIVLMADFLFGSKATSTWTAIGWTLARILIGFSISFVLAGVLGILAGFFAAFYAFMRPIVGVFRAIPTAAVVIILVSLFIRPDLFQHRSYIPCVLVFLVCFPLIFEAFAAGIRNESRDVRDSLAIECGAKSLSSLKVYLPDMTPYVLLAATQSLGLAVKVSVMSELLIYSSQGTSHATGIGILIVFERMQGSVENIIPLSIIALLMVLFVSVPLWILKSRLKAETKK